MFSPLELVTRIGDKAGSIGALVSAMGCAMCFPAIASLGAAIGMGFLSQWEGVFINTLLPLFAVLALAMNILGWLSHRQWYCSFIGSIGPTLVLLSLYPWFQYGGVHTLLIRARLMVAVSIWDMVSPANKRCDDETCTA